MPAPLTSRATAIRSTGLSGLLLASALLLSGCAGMEAAASPPDPAATAGMSHGGMMHDGMTHDEMTDDTGGNATAGAKPSAAAAMICSPEIRDAIASVLALPAPVEGEDSYLHGHYACTYPLQGGPLELSVHEAADGDEAQAYADSLRGEYGTAEDIEGLANLGFPAYRTEDGAVVFVKDSMVLVVDAREVTVPQGEGQSPADAAYQIATNVLACWKEHHSG